MNIGKFIFKNTKKNIYIYMYVDTLIIEDP